MVRIDYTQPTVMLDLWGGTSGTFAGIDRFGRVIDQRWRYYGSTPADRDRYQYGYDRNSNRIWKQNCVGSALDEYYTYDNLNRLTNMDRGTLNTGKTAIDGTPAAEQDWTLDPTGNWSAFLTKTNGTTDLNQTRSANTVNEITAIGGTPDWADPTYDSAGNTITFPKADNPTQSLTAVYDAWNRMTQVADSTNTVAGYQYDGKNRRIVRLVYTSGSLSETRHYYFSRKWQDVEERVGTLTTMDVQYVWGIRFLDEIILRNRLFNNVYDWMFACYDANRNITCIYGNDGVIIERYIYRPYGTVSICDGLWNIIDNSFYNWNVRYHGLLYDWITTIYYERNRNYNMILGLHLSRDIITNTSSVLSRYNDGMNLYEYVKNNPVSGIDSSGLSYESDVERNIIRCAVKKSNCSHQENEDDEDNVDCDNNYRSCMASIDPAIVPTTSDSKECEKYPCNELYYGASLRCFCKCAGDSGWSLYVRGCLRRMAENNVDTEKAHDLCYELGDGVIGMSERPWDKIAICLYLCQGSSCPPPPCTPIPNYETKKKKYPILNV